MIGGGRRELPLFYLKNGTMKINFFDIRAEQLSQKLGAMKSDKFWRWGADNLLPVAFAKVNRRSPVHRSILNRKTTYTIGKSILSDNPKIQEIIDNANIENETLRDITRKIWFDKYGFGIGWVEVVGDMNKNWLNIYHHDSIKCRKDKKGKKVLLHSDWSKQQTDNFKTKSIPIFPEIKYDLAGKTYRTAFYVEEYESQFKNYPLPSYIAGFKSGAIAYKTTDWNVARIDNSFNGSGIITVLGDFESDQEARKFKQAIKKNYTGKGNQGKLIFTQVSADGKKTEFTPLNSGNDADWTSLHTQSTNDLIVAHSWFRSLSGLTDNTGFDTQRILNEYNVAMSTVIEDEQTRINNFWNNIFERLLGIKSEISIINKPPVVAKQPYMKVWEARKMDGLPYDEEDPEQQITLSELNKGTTINIGEQNNG